MKQLTFGGNNAEAYWSFDGQKLTFQSDFKNWGADCDQIFWFRPFQDDLKSVVPNYISKKKGRTTCSYFMPGDSTILFASTCGNGENCPMFLRENLEENMSGLSIILMKFIFQI